MTNRDDGRREWIRLKVSELGKGEKTMFCCNYKTLSLSFNEFHNIDKKDMPQYGEFCLLELKDGRYTGGEWNPEEYPKASVKGKFIRGTADAISSDEVAKWHSLDRYDLSACLENEEMGNINMGSKEEDTYSVKFKGFKSTRDGKCPKEEQYCLLIMMDGGLAAGRWKKYRGKNRGAFIYAPALSSHSVDKVWAWTPLSSDEFFEAEEEEAKERRRERELNKNPSTDQEKFKYGIDINVYYEKALEKLRKEYPWATITQMKKGTPWEIVPRHGQYVFGQGSGSYKGERIIHEWNGGNTADEFIDFLCEHAKEYVKNANPEEKFKYGMDIEVYLEKAYENVKKDYRWLDKKMLKDACQYSIKQVDGDWEFIEKYKGNRHDFICECGSAERFIERVEEEYKDAALNANPVVAEYEPPFKNIEIRGWTLEKYKFYKLKSGDYKVVVQAGDRVTGGTRTFFITPYCFEAKTYDEFLERYLEIVPGKSFGLSRKNLLPNKELKSFLGY